MAKAKLETILEKFKYSVKYDEGTHIWMRVERKPDADDEHEYEMREEHR